MALIWSSFEKLPPRTGKILLLALCVGVPLIALGYYNAFMERAYNAAFDRNWPLWFHRLSDEGVTCKLPYHLRQKLYWGFVDTRGRVVVPVLYEAVRNFENGKGMVFYHGYGCYVDYRGRKIGSERLEADLLREVAPTKPGRRSIISGITPEGDHLFRKNGRVGLKSRNGKVLIEARYDAVGSFHEGYAPVALRLTPIQLQKEIETSTFVHCGFIDKQGKQIIEPRYSGARFFREGLCPVQLGMYWGFIDKAGKMVIAPQYENAYPFYNGLAAVCLDQKWGYINRDGKPFAWSDDHFLPIRSIDFSDGIGTVYRKGKGWQYIDRQGKIKTGAEVFDPRLKQKSMSYEHSNFREGLAAFRTGVKQIGYIDTVGRMKIAPVYADALPFSEGQATVNYSGRFGSIDRDGKFVIPPRYFEMGSFHEGLALVGVPGPAHAGASVNDFWAPDVFRNEPEQSYIGGSPFPRYCMLRDNDVMVHH